MRGSPSFWTLTVAHRLNNINHTEYCYYVVVVVVSAVGENHRTVSQQEAKNSVFRMIHNKSRNVDHLKTLLRVQVMGGTVSGRLVIWSLRHYLITQWSYGICPEVGHHSWGGSR